MDEVRVNKEELCVDLIESIRAKNNKLWMEILRLALAYAPTSTKSVLSQINENDRKISELLGKLADDC